MLRSYAQSAKADNRRQECPAVTIYLFIYFIYLFENKCSIIVIIHVVFFPFFFFFFFPCRAKIILSTILPRDVNLRSTGSDHSYEELIEINEDIDSINKAFNIKKHRSV